MTTNNCQMPNNKSHAASARFVNSSGVHFCFCRRHARSFVNANIREFALGRINEVAFDNPTVVLAPIRSMITIEVRA